MRSPHLPTIEIKGHFLKNPFVVLPYATPITNPVGRVTPELLMHYKALARSEAALVIAGPATITTPPTRKASLLRIDQPKYLDGLRALIKIISSNGAIPGVQLAHTGDCKIEAIQETKVNAFPGRIKNLEPDKVLSAYRNAAARACEVGFKYVEINASGFGLLHQLCAENHPMVAEIITTIAQEATEDVAFGFRLDPKLENAQPWVDLFLKEGGDLIAFEANADLEVPPKYAFATLNEPLEAEELNLRLKNCRLFGLPFNFQHKNRQVLKFYQI